MSTRDTPAERSVPPHMVRLALLDQLHALLSNYLADECPDDEAWEHFDPAIDGMRSQIDGLQNHEVRYLASLPARPLQFVVDIEFLAQFDHFATETYSVSAFDWTRAKCAAFRLADNSPYNDERIPDLSRRAIHKSDEADKPPPPRQPEPL